MLDMAEMVERMHDIIERQNDLIRLQALELLQLNAATAEDLAAPGEEGKT
jgi:hypothetical protein